MGGRGKADRQAPRFAHREDEGVVVGSQQSDEKEEGVKKAPCACRWELLSPLSTPRSCISYMTDSVFDRPTSYDQEYIFRMFLPPASGDPSRSENKFFFFVARINS